MIRCPMARPAADVIRADCGEKALTTRALSIPLPIPKKHQNLRSRGLSQPPAAEEQIVPAAQGDGKVPAYSWYALSVLVLIYVLNFVDRQILDPGE